MQKNGKEIVQEKATIDQKLTKLKKNNNRRNEKKEVRKSTFKKVKINSKYFFWDKEKSWKE